MKLRKPKDEMTDAAEREAVEAVRRLEEIGHVEPHVLPQTYFANLIVKTNQTIDHVTSGKALSMSWLARVAVPGVVAILFFFIGLHYYAPENMSQQHSVAEAVRTLSAEDIDSLVVNASSDGSLAAADLHADLFVASTDQLAEFFLASGNPTTVLEVLPEQQLTEVASILESHSTNL